MNDHVSKRIQELETKQMHLIGMANGLGIEIQQLKNSCMYTSPPNNPNTIYGNGKQFNNMYGFNNSYFTNPQHNRYFIQDVSLDDLSRLHGDLFNGMLMYFQSMLNNVLNDHKGIAVSLMGMFINVIKDSGIIDTSLNSSTPVLRVRLVEIIDNIINTGGSVSLMPRDHDKQVEIGKVLGDIRSQIIE